MQFMFDRELKSEDIQSISNPDEVITFFNLLGYETSGGFQQTVG
jgi:hypothetical protein